MKLHTSGRKTVLGGLIVVLCLAVASIAWAKIPLGSCDACHSPHGGFPMYEEYQGNQGCINCHSSDTSSTSYILNPGGNPEITVPVVVYTGAGVPTSYLSGGNFWWVKGPATGDPQDPNYWTGGCDDTKGHNIFPGEDDDYLSSAPYVAYGSDCGGPSGNSCHDNLNRESFQLAYPGVNGKWGCTSCHGVYDFVAPGHMHHADDTLDPVVGADLSDSDAYFRFLMGHSSGSGHGVCGIEDDDWEATSNSSDHNEYLGFSGAKNAAGNLSVLGHTVTGFCCGCHGNKHISSDSAGGGDWIRHPSGASPLDNAYTEYSPRVPASRPDLTGWTVPSSTVTPVTDMVMCLSCHRAHGSPYPKMLRWETVGGCDDCHKGAIQCP
jgi:predicted CXXCH cytochrome family protein